MIIRYLALVSLLFTSALVIAEEIPTPQELEQKLRVHIPDLAPVDEVNATPLPCLYEVVIGPTVFYSTADGSFLVDGEILSLGVTTTSLTAQTHDKLRLQMIDTLPDDLLIYYGPKENKHVITVFSSLDCPHCQTFHAEIAKLNKQGVTVRYAAYPIRPPGSSAYLDMARIWNSPDPARAMDEAMSGKALPQEWSADDARLLPQIELAQTLQLSGTPSIVLENGAVMYGFVPASVLLQRLAEE